MNSIADQTTLPGLPAPATADVRAGSPNIPGRSLFPLPAAEAIASSFSDALMVCGPSFNGECLERRAVNVLRFIACNLDVICGDDVFMLRDLDMLRARLDVFLDAGA